MKILENKTITDVPYFKAIGIHCGVKKKRKDLCIIYSEKKAVAAGTFTTNKVKAAPVILNIENIKSCNTQAIVVNSGNANACTGEMGAIHTEVMATELASCLGLDKNQILVASTGVIGVPLPINKIVAGINDTYKKLGNSTLG